MRKIMLAHFFAVIMLAVTPACSAERGYPNDDEQPASSNNLGNGAKGAEQSLPESGAPVMGNLAASQPDGADALAAFGQPSGTIVSTRVFELRDEVLRLRSSVANDSNEFNALRANGANGAVQYHSTVAAITARLQNGTTRGNPILLRQWDEAEASLNQVVTSLDRLNNLQTSVAGNSSVASYLLESIQAGFQLSGAVDEDHDQLKILRDDVGRLVVQLDHLRNQVADDIERQTTYATTERANLQTLAFAITRGELLGNSLANRPVIVSPATMLAVSQPDNGLAPAPASAPAGAVSSANGGLNGMAGPAPMSPREYMGETAAQAPAAASQNIGRLLVLIRFNQPVVDYEQQLAKAVSAALDRQPDSTFSIIAVSPTSGDPSNLAAQSANALRNAQNVKRSLVQLGLAPARISVGSTQLQSANSPEVHVYIR